MTELDRIKKWCAFDSDVGFGRLSYRKENALAGEIFGGEVYLRASFLTVNTSNSRHDRCEFMTGYIQGVLKAILSRIYDVEHFPSVELSPEETETQSCRFEFKVRR